MSFKAMAADGVTTKALSGGARNSIALKSDGTVLGWGHNGFGESGSSGVSVSSAITNPVAMGGIVSNAVSVSTGGWDSTYYAHSLVLRSDGTVVAGGNNYYGQLGDGTTSNRSSAVLVTNLANAVAVVAGGYHSLAVKADGTVWAWGNDTYGQIGSGSPTPVAQKLPLQVTNTMGVLTGIVAVAAGQYHSLALAADGTVWAWGANSLSDKADGSGHIVGRDRTCNWPVTDGSDVGFRTLA